jgi:hypothetical protein
MSSQTIMNETNEGIVSISPNEEYVAFYYLNLLENNSIIKLFESNNLSTPFNEFKYKNKTNIYSISWCADNQYFLFINNNKLFLSDLYDSIEVPFDILNNENILLKTVVFHPEDINSFILSINTGDLFFFNFKLNKENRFEFNIIYSFSFLDKSPILASIFSNNSEHIALINSNNIITIININNINYNTNSYSNNNNYKEITNKLNSSRKKAELNQKNILLCNHSNKEIPSCILNITRNNRKEQIKKGNLQINPNNIQITHLYISDNKPIFEKINQVSIPSENIIIEFINSRNSLINIPVIAWSPDNNFIGVSINNSLIIKKIEEENKQIKLNFKCNISILWHPTINNIICCFSNSIIYIIKLFSLKNNFNINYQIINTIKKISTRKIISVYWKRPNFLIIGYSDGMLEEINFDIHLLIGNPPTTLPTKMHEKIEKFVKTGEKLMKQPISIQTEENKARANELRRKIFGPESRYLHLQ